jgi:hypothetical protein
LKWPSTRFGSKEGCDARTSTRPVEGPESVHRDPLCSRVDRRDDVVSLLGEALELVERVVEDGVEVRVRASQEVVQRLLETRARPLNRRVTDRVGDEPVLGIDAQKPRPAEALLLHLAVPGEDGLAVGAEDPPALDGQLLDEQIGIPAPGFEVRGLPEPPGGHADDRHEEGDQDEEEPPNLRVHVLTVRSG